MTIDANIKTPGAPGGDFVFADGAFSFLQPIDLPIFNAPAAQSPDGSSGSGLSLPFQNLDPYDTEGKDGLPEGMLDARPDGAIDILVGVSGGAGDKQVTFDLDLTDHVFDSSGGRVQIMELFDARTTAITMSSFNGQSVPVVYQSSSAFGFEGQFHDQLHRTMFVRLDTETAEAFQAEAFDRDGNPILTSYVYEQFLSVEGQAFDYGIAAFMMEFEIAVELTLNEFGFYTMTMSVFFEGEINYSNGAERSYGFEDDMAFVFSSLDQVSFDQMPSGLMFEIERFASGMGEAWDGLDLLNDQLEAVLLQLRDQGHYDRWDDVNQGLGNPFNFDLPSVDLWG